MMQSVNSDDCPAAAAWPIASQGAACMPKKNKGRRLAKPSLCPIPVRGVAAPGSPAYFLP
jgi:hypothetical protein